MLLKRISAVAGLALTMALAFGCCHHQQSACTKPAVVGSVPIAQPAPGPCCPNQPGPPPGAVIPPGNVPPGNVPPPPPNFIPSAKSGVIVPQPY